MTNSKSKNEFLAFISSDKSPDSHIEKNLLGTLRTKTTPTLSRVLLKTFAFHVAAVLLTLIFCPQFGLSIGPYSLTMDAMMRFGMNVCMFGCGFFFLGSSALFYSLALNVFERKALQTSFYALPLLLGILSYGGFFLFGFAQLNIIAVYWLLGAVVGGLLIGSATDLLKNFALRRRLYARL